MDLRQPQDEIDAKVAQSDLGEVPTYLLLDQYTYAAATIHLVQHYDDQLPEIEEEVFINYLNKLRNELELRTQVEVQYG